MFVKNVIILKGRKMLNATELAAQADQIMGLLKSTGREGMNELLVWLVKNDFFNAPASTKFHGCYKGGLAKHSLGVYETLESLVQEFEPQTDHGGGMKPLELTSDTVIIAALLHDLCKVNQYLGTEKPYKWNGKNPAGHATLSIERIQKFIKLTELEEMMIRYHMGLYGLVEFNGTTGWQAKNGEYCLLGDYTDCPFDAKTEKVERQKWGYGKSMRNAYYHNPIVKLMSFADEIATMEEKTLEV